MSFKKVKISGIWIDFIKKSGKGFVFVKYNIVYL
jgi:hypothetical protein